ncbi:hypothetical protein VTN00DRAFT_2219 [Thermoascus crustaceus]|uniref:uncharacterized protein n=1 Tax=Thermoascus crustaceus TaxID=5088 RepID=UPI003743D92E
MFARLSRDGVANLRRHLTLGSRRVPLLSTSPRRPETFAQYHDSSNNAQNESRSRSPRARRGSINRNRHRRRPEGQRVVLDVTSLGKPGEILVVPNRKRRRQIPEVQEETNTKKQETGKEEDGLPFMLGELGKELESVADTAEISNNIENFRSSYRPHDKLNLEAWIELRKTMERSFTADQLWNYISRFEQSDLVSVEGRERNAGSDNATWKPGTSLFLETNPEFQERISNRVAAAQDLRGKILLVEKILRDCWQLGVHGEVGQLDVHLPSYAISLLPSSERCSFDNLADSYEANMDIDRALNLVRITGSQHSCEAIRDIIQDSASQICNEEVSLSPHSGIRNGNSGQLSTEFLQWVEKMYPVVCERKPRESVGTLYYLPENKTEADKARRDIQLALYRQIATPIPFCTYLPTSKKATVYSVNTENTASWFDREKKWFRWATASTRTADPQGFTAPFFDAHQSRISGDLLTLLRGTPNASRDLPERNQITESLTATVGKCLFLEKPGLDETTINATRLGELSLPRIFTTDIPKVAPFIRLLTPFPGSIDRQLHRIRLTPTAEKAHTLPSLELDIEMSGPDVSPYSDRALAIRRVKAVLLENSIDYLIPENGLDLRFTRRIYSDLFNNKRPDGALSNDLFDRNDKVFIESIESSLESILKRVRPGIHDTSLPAFCHISLPRKLIEDMFLGDRPSKDKDLETAEANGGSDEYIKSEYVFPPLDDFSGSRIHTYDFYGERLTYNYYESGPLLPKHTTNLSLDMDVTDDRIAQSRNSMNTSLSDGTLTQEFHSFYNTACKLAFILGGHREKGFLSAGADRRM